MMTQKVVNLPKILIYIKMNLKKKISKNAYFYFVIIYGNKNKNLKISVFSKRKNKFAKNFSILDILKCPFSDFEMPL